MKKILLIVLNIIVLMTALCTSVAYSRNLRNEKTEIKKEAFEKNMDSMKQISHSSLDSECGFVSNWANFLTINDITVDEAMRFLSEVNTNPEVSAQIIDMDTCSGKVSLSGWEESEYPAVDYSNAEKEVLDKLDDVYRCCKGMRHMHITRTYINPWDGTEIVGVCRNVKLLDDNGENKNYILIRAVPEAVLKKQWVFPVGYEQAEVALIKRNGDFVIGLDTMSGDSFTELLRSSNELSELQMNEIQNRLLTEDSGTLELKNSDGIDAFWSFTALQENNDYLLVGYIPESAFDSSSDWTVVFIVGVTLLLLFLLDGIVLFHMQRLLRKSTKEAHSANNAKTRFLSVMSHDLRAPLNAVVGTAAIASEHLDDTEQIQNHLKKVTYLSNQMLRLVNDLLDISLVESGRIILNPIVFSIAELSDNLVNMVRPQIEEKSLKFNVYVRNVRHEYIYADELRINQIFINILTNAVKYTPEGGTVTMTLSEETPVNSGSVRLVYIVEDSGIGMPEENIRALKDGFPQTGEGHFYSARGTGLGLIIIKQMTDILEGKIDIQSDPHKGTVFRITLDLPIAEKVSNDFKLPAMRMLAADDDKIFLETACGTLNSMGVQTDIAYSGQQAAEMAVSAAERGVEYSGIIVCWKQPGTDVLKTVRSLRSCIDRSIPIIIVSAYDLSDAEKAARESGADGVIDKPLFASTLYYKINELLQQ